MPRKAQRRRIRRRLGSPPAMLSVIAMSGGVDSSVAAALTAERRGQEAVLGVALRLYSTEEHAVRSGRSCCAPDDLHDARRAAAALGIRFYVYDAQERFRTEVIDDFVRAYARGGTPTPCARCNEQVKFDWLLDRARRLGADELVTGHYARIERGPDGAWQLLRARDTGKDQSYFLHRLTQDELAVVRFPLGELTKPQVRELARRGGLPNADKPESMEVCFVAGRPVAEFLEAHGVGAARGEIVDTAGRVLGEHGGIHHFTPGQRHGLGVSHRLPLYVAALDAGNQRVVVGSREEVARRSFRAASASWVCEPPMAGAQCEVQIRHRGRPLPAEVMAAPDGSVQVLLREPAVGVAPGQS